MMDDRKIRISPELMDTMCTRDHDGNRLRVEWGYPDAEGFYRPRIHVDYTDNPLRQRLELYEEIARVAGIDLAESAAGTDALRASLAAGDTISDGFGNTWSATCLCGGKMQVVRPGKVQCSECG